MRALWPIPEGFHEHAYFVGNGEAFWPLGIAPDLVRAVSSCGLSIFYGEIYFGRGMLWGNLDIEWTVARKPVGEEAWPAYVQRSAGEAIAVLLRASAAVAAGEAPLADREPMCFFAVGTERDYPFRY